MFDLPYVPNGGFCRVYIRTLVPLYLDDKFIQKKRKKEWRFTQYEKKNNQTRKWKKKQLYIQQNNN